MCEANIYHTRNSLCLTLANWTTLTLSPTSQRKGLSRTRRLSRILVTRPSTATIQKIVMMHLSSRLVLRRHHRLLWRTTSLPSHLRWCPTSFDNAFISTLRSCVSLALASPVSCAFEEAVERVQSVGSESGSVSEYFCLRTRLIFISSQECGRRFKHCMVVGRPALILAASDLCSQHSAP